MRAYTSKFFFATALILCLLQMPAIGGITAIIGIAPRTALVRTAMSVRLKNSCAARNQEMRLANKAISARLLGK